MKIRLRHLLLIWVALGLVITVATPVIFVLLDRAKVEFPSPN